MSKEKEGKNGTAETAWFHLFRAMIVGGGVREMGPVPFTVYCVIKSHVDFATGQAFPSVPRIQELTGCSKSTVLRSLKTLEDLGYLTKQKQGRKNIYTLREKIDFVDDQGRPSAVATWDYIPRSVQMAQAELKNFMLDGKTDCQIIHINQLNLQLNFAPDCSINAPVESPKGKNPDEIQDERLRAIIERIEAKKIGVTHDTN